MTTEAIQPWYKQPWAWFVLTPMLVVLIVCAITVTIAFRHADDVVTDNYYKEGRMINQRLEQDRRATQMGLAGSLRFDLEVGEVLLSLSAAPEYEASLPDRLLVLLIHPTSAAHDRRIPFKRVGPGRYRADLERSLSYRWYVQLLPELDIKKRNQAEWRLTGEIDFQHQNAIEWKKQDQEPQMDTDENG